MLKIISNRTIKKIFIRSDDKVIKEEEKLRFKSELESYGCNNFDIQYICYKGFKTDNFTWQRDYIPWNTFFR